jgi:hypothetical protein
MLLSATNRQQAKGLIVMLRNCKFPERTGASSLLGWRCGRLPFAGHFANKLQVSRAVSALKGRHHFVRGLKIPIKASGVQPIAIIANSLTN